MSTLSQFVSKTRIATSLVRTPPASITSGSGAAGAAAATITQSGAITANTLISPISLSGRGQVNWFGFYRTNTTAKTLRVKITIDGTAVYDYTDASSAVNGEGFVAVGASGGSAPYVATFQPLYWNTSLLIQVTYSATESNGASYAINYEVHA